MEHLVIWLPNASDVPNWSLSWFKRGAGGSREETGQTLDERAEQNHLSQLLFCPASACTVVRVRNGGIKDPTWPQTIETNPHTNEKITTFDHELLGNNMPVRV